MDIKGGGMVSALCLKADGLTGDLYKRNECSIWIAKNNFFPYVLPEIINKNYKIYINLDVQHKHKYPLMATGSLIINFNLFRLSKPETFYFMLTLIHTHT